MTDATEWDKRYGATEQLFPLDPDEALVEFAAPLAPGRALDLGAGEGRNSLWLARHGWKVVAVDFSSVALDRLRAVADDERLDVSIAHADLDTFLESGGPFDLVVLANIHPVPEERERLLAAAATAVGPSGHLFLIGHHLDSLGLAGPTDPARLYREELLRDAFPGLEVECLERRERTREPGIPPLVDVVLWAKAPSGRSRT